MWVFIYKKLLIVFHILVRVCVVIQLPLLIAADVSGNETVVLMAFGCFIMGVISFINILAISFCDGVI